MRKNHHDSAPFLGVQQQMVDLILAIWPTVVPRNGNDVPLDGADRHGP